MESVTIPLTKIPIYFSIYPKNHLIFQFVFQDVKIKLMRTKINLLLSFSFFIFFILVFPSSSKVLAAAPAPDPSQCQYTTGQMCLSGASCTSHNSRYTAGTGSCATGYTCCAGTGAAACRAPNDTICGPDCWDLSACKCPATGTPTETGDAAGTCVGGGGYCLSDLGQCPVIVSTPNCNSGPSCGACSNSCGSGTQSCTYTTYSGGGACTQVGAPSQSCTGTTCVGTNRGSVYDL